MEFPQKIKNKNTTSFSHSTTEYLPKENENMYLKMYITPVFLAVLYKIAKIQKQPKCPLLDEWIRRCDTIYIMEYYSAIKKNEILLFATT